MPEETPIEEMPRDVKNVRMILWLQTFLNALGSIVLLLVVSNMSGHGQDVGILPLFPILSLALSVLLGALAVGCSSRRRWVRTTTFGVEGIIIVLQLLSILLAFNIGSIIGLLVAIAAIVRMSRYDAATWFTR